MPVDYEQEYLSRIRERDQRKQALADENRQRLMQNAAAVQKNIDLNIAHYLDPNNPGQPLQGKEQVVAELRKHRATMEQYINNLSHPNFNPESGKVEEPALRKITDKLHITKEPVQNRTAGQQMQDIAGIREKYATEPSLLTPDEQKEAAKVAAGLEPRAGAEKPKKGLKFDKTTGEVLDQDTGARYSKGNPNNPPEVAQMFKDQGTAAPPKAETDPAVITAMADNWQKYGVKPPAKFIPEVEKYMADKKMHPKEPDTKWHTSGQPYQRDGKWYVAEATTSGEVREVPMPTGYQGKPTSDVMAARKDYEAAVKLSSIADQVQAHPDDAINQKRLAVALERASAGRFTTQALDYIIKAGWGNTIEQWANNPSTGALPTDVLRQLVDGAHQNVKAAKDALDAAQQLSSGSTNKQDVSDDDFLKKF